MGTAAASILTERADAAEARLRIAKARLENRALRIANGRLAQLSSDYKTRSGRRGKLRTGPPAPRTSADAQLTASTLEELWADSQRALRQSPAARSMVGKMVTLTVGEGPTLQCRTADKAWNDKAEAIFEDFCTKYADVRGLSTFGQLVGMAAEHLLVDGDCGVIKVGRRDWAPEEEPAAVGHLQFIEAQRIVTPSGNRLATCGTGKASIVNGVEMDASGRPVNYWIANYTDAGTVRRTPGEVTPVAAGDFMFLVSPKRFSQTRGEPRLAAMLPMLEWLDRYIDATVIGAEIAACTALLIKRQNAALAQQAALGRTEERADGQDERIEELFPGMIRYLAPGDDAVQLKPEQPGVAFDAFVRMLLRLSGADLDLPIEASLLDFSTSSAYAGRTGFKLAGKAFNKIRGRLRTQLLTPTRHWVLGMAIARGDLAYREDWQKHGWGWPAEISFEPDRDVKAETDAVNQNFKTKRQVIEERGEDYEEVMDQRAREVAYERKLGIEPMQAPGTKPGGEPTRQAPANQAAEAA